MSLQTRLEALVAAIGADVKAIKNAPAGGPGLQSSNGDGFVPKDHGFSVWAFDPVSSPGSQSLTTAGKMYGQRLYTPVPILITNIWLYVGSAGATLTAEQNKCALYDATGALVGTTVSQHLAWTSTGGKQMALEVPYTMPAGYFDIGVWRNGTTAPQITRGSTSSALHNINIPVVANWKIWDGASGLTTTAPATLTKTAPALGSLWFAVN